MSDTDRTPVTPTPPPASSSPVDGLTAPITSKVRLSVFQRIMRLFRR
jgi:hypothetical protein